VAKIQLDTWGWAINCANPGVVEIYKDLGGSSGFSHNQAQQHVCMLKAVEGAGRREPYSLQFRCEFNPDSCELRIFDFHV
jgi:hypothetical protein